MRKLLTLLFLPVIAAMTMGSALVVTAEATATEQTSISRAANVGQEGVDAGIARLFIQDDSMSDEERDRLYATSHFLPTNRWTDMSYHSRVNWWNPVEASNATTSRGVAGMAMTFGNSSWKVATDWSRMAMEFKPLNSALGHQIDKIAGVIGNAITGQPVLFSLIITTLLVVVMWRAMKRPGTRPFGKLLQSAVVFGLIMMMGTQAAAGSAGAISDTYNPHVGSPVWIAGAVTGTIDVMAGSAVAGVMDGMLPIITSGIAADAGGHGWSCSAMTQGALDAAAYGNAPTSGAKAVSLSMNSMWVATAFNTYAVVQFGDSNRFAKDVACRQLERTTNKPAYTRTQLLSQSIYGSKNTITAANISTMTPFAGPNVPMLQSTSDNEANDAAMVAWAACKPQGEQGSSFVVQSGWSDLGITTATCRAAFSATTADEMKGAGGGVFNVESTDAAREKTSNSEVINFVSTLHGKDAGTALGTVTSSIVFAIGALVAAGVFGVMSLAVVGSKLFMLIMVAVLFLILVVSLFKDETFSDTMRQPTFRFLGVTLFSFGATLLLALVATVSLIIASLAGMLGPAGSFGAMLWVSFSPLLAVIGTHFLFTKLFKIPSPMTAKGALAWGTAGGAVGAAVGTSVANRMQSRGASMGRALGRKVLESNKYTGRFFDHGRPSSRRGAGDAGSRGAEFDALSSDILSQKVSERAAGDDSRLGAGAGGPGDDAAMAASANAQEAMKNLSSATKREIQRDAKRQWRAENPNVLQRGLGNLKGTLETRNAARAGALADAVAAGELDESSMLNAGARGTVGLINRSAMDGFLMAPGEETTVAAIPAAKWADLSPEGKAAAVKLAAANSRKAREAAKAERMRQAALRRATLAAARAELPPLSDRAKNAVRATANTVTSTARRSSAAAGSAASQAARTAWAEARTKALEFRVDPTGTALGAASATVDAARKASYTAAEGAAKARQVVERTVAMTQSDKGRAAARAIAIGAGGAVAALGNPVVGATMLTVAAGRGAKQIGERQSARRQAKQTQLNEIIAARATARKNPQPRTSTVSQGEPLHDIGL